jgi:hypothetical protein
VGEWGDLDAAARAHARHHDRAAGDRDAEPQDAAADPRPVRVAQPDARGFLGRRLHRRPAVTLGFDYPDAIDWEDL